MMDNGANPGEIAVAYGIPKMSLYNWINADPELTQRSKTYQISRGDHAADEISSMTRIDRLQKVFDQQVDEGKPNPALGRLIFELRSWTAKTSNPEKYGDKRQLEVRQHTRVEYVEELREMSRKKMKDITPEQKKIK